jgi:hypothetical protein
MANSVAKQDSLYKDFETNGLSCINYSFDAIQIYPHLLQEFKDYYDWHAVFETEDELLRMVLSRVRPLEEVYGYHIDNHSPDVHIPTCIIWTVLNGRTAINSRGKFEKQAGTTVSLEEALRLCQPGNSGHGPR